MAQGMFKKILQEKEKNYYRYNIQSAGISAIPGMKPTDEAIKVMLEYGIDISQYKSQPLEEDLVKEADLILVMASEHQEYIQIRYPFAQNKVFLVKEFSQRKYLNKVQKKENDKGPIKLLVSKTSTGTKAVIPLNKIQQY